MRFAWPVLLTITLLALFVWPWSNQQSQLMREQYETRGDLDRVAAGQFQENASGSRVFFIERDDLSAASSSPESASSTASTTAEAAPGKTGRNVFISSNEKDKQAVTSARSGRLERINEDQFLILNNGQRIEQTTAQNSLKVSEFAQYSVKVGQNRVLTPETTPPKAVRTNRLLREPTPAHMAELSWRLGLALAAVNLALLALVVSATNPRAGRGFSLVFALLAFLVYYNMLNIGFSWVSTGKISFASLMWGLHGGVSAATCLWLAARNRNWSLRNLLPMRA